MTPCPRNGVKAPFFTTTDVDTVTADKTHRGHAIIEQFNTDLKDSGLAHQPSGNFTANAAWLLLATIAFNLSRAIGTLTGIELGKARSGTILRKLISIPARLSTSARKSCFTCRATGPGKPDGTCCSRRPAAHHKQRPSDPQPRGATRTTEHPGSEAGSTTISTTPKPRSHPGDPPSRSRPVDRGVASNFRR